MSSFTRHLSSDYLIRPMTPLISQYLKKSDVIVNPSESAKLISRANIPDERSIQHRHDQFIPRKVSFVQPHEEMARVANER